MNASPKFRFASGRSGSLLECGFHSARSVPANHYELLHPTSEISICRCGYVFVYFWRNRAMVPAGKLLAYLAYPMRSRAKRLSYWFY